MWEEELLAELASKVGRFDRVDLDSLSGDNRIFARVCVEIDVTQPLKRCLELE